MSQLSSEQRTKDFSADLALALRMADAADSVTMARFGASDLVVDAKPDLTPVSDADRAVEQLIRAQLGRERPDDALLGEEFGSAGTSSRRWVIDPIDGTKNFVRNAPAWATLIALLDDDHPVVGVVSAPALGRRWWAVQSGGAWVTAPGRQARRITVSQVSDLGDASLSYASLSGWIDRGLGDAFIELTQRVWRTRAYGDFWSYMMVAEGSVDIAAEPELALWDMAALVPIVLEAGGRFTGLNGVDGPFQASAAVSNGRLHADLLVALKGSAGTAASPTPAD